MRITLHCTNKKISKEEAWLELAANDKGKVQLAFDSIVHCYDILEEEAPVLCDIGAENWLNSANIPRRSCFSISSTMKTEKRVMLTHNTDWQAYSWQDFLIFFKCEMEAKRYWDAALLFENFLEPRLFCGSKKYIKQIYLISPKYYDMYWHLAPYYYSVPYNKRHTWC